MSAFPTPRGIIARKREGLVLSEGEIDAFVRGAVDGTWGDGQLGALLMAVCLRGMDRDETLALTKAMLRSGPSADLSAYPGPRAGKHSTGGVGDKISLPLSAMIAACGVAAPMICGRALGHTGGTVDKLDSIPGFRTALSLEQYRVQVERIGLALVGQTAELAPADRRLYALRDVTGTVESIPLICSSILSKKLAEGIEVLVLDVKFGRGAFMKDREEARELAETLVFTAGALGTKARAALTGMDEPLGRTVGNALEVAESIECLKGRGPTDVMEVVFALGEQMLGLSGIAQARGKLEKALASGLALETFLRMVEAQGGNPRIADDPRLLPQAPITSRLVSSAEGWIRDVDAWAIASAALKLGAGREQAGAPIDPSAGISELVKRGERIGPGDTLCVLHGRSDGSIQEAAMLAQSAITFASAAPAPIARISGWIG